MATRLREIRDEKGVTAAELSRRGVAIRNVFRIENDPDHDPRLSTVVAIANALNVSLDELVGHDVDGKRSGVGVGHSREAAA